MRPASEISTLKEPTPSTMELHQPILRPIRMEADRRIPVLDGVRGLAICLVMVVHFLPDYVMPNRYLEWLKKLGHTGWTGVDLFFVLSGMLITDILLRTRGTDNAAFRFYVRRFIRIMPLYLASLVFTFCLLPWFVVKGVDPKFDIMQSVQAWYWVHCANIIVFLHGFSAMMSDTTTLAHFWSLAVEEHFYLFWPLVVWSLSERRLLWVATGLIITAFSLRVVAVFFFDSVQGFNVQTLTRMDALAFGGAIAILFRQTDPKQLRKISLFIFPVTVTIITVVFYLQAGLWSRSTFVSTIGLSLIALGYSCLIVILRTSKEGSLTVRLVDNWPLRFFGKYSYGLYVLHAMLGPLMMLWLPENLVLEYCGSPLLASFVIVAAKISISIVAALLSWNIVEAPCLRLKDRFQYGR